MKTSEVKVQFIEVTASISSRALRQILEAVIQETFTKPNFWIDQLHFYAAHVEPSCTGFTVTLNGADIADRAGFFSPKVTDDQLKGLLLPALASMLEAQARRLVDRELWLRAVHVVKVDRNPPATVNVKQYSRWL